MSNAPEHAALLVDLDSILDTRAVVLLKSFPTEFEKIIASDYHSRFTDDFEGVGIQAFNSAYMKRDESVVREAIATPILELINRFVKQTVTASMTSPFVRRPRIDVNIWPYKLSDKTLGSIVAGIAARSGGYSDVSIVSYSPEQLTPRLIKERYVELIMYHWVDWIAQPEHNQDLIDGIVRENILIGPALLKDRQTVEANRNTSALTVAAVHYSQFIRLNLIAPSYFSFDYERYVETQGKQRSGA